MRPSESGDRRRRSRIGGEARDDQGRKPAEERPEAEPSPDSTLPRTPGCRGASWEYALQSSHAVSTKKLQQEVNVDPHPPRSRQGDESLPGRVPDPAESGGGSSSIRTRRPASPPTTSTPSGAGARLRRGRPGRECRRNHGRVGVDQATWPSAQATAIEAPERVQATASGGLSSFVKRTIRPTVGCQTRTVRSAPIETTIGGSSSGRRAEGEALVVLHNSARVLAG